MPKIIGHTPSWLSRPSPGAKIFSDLGVEPPTSPKRNSPQDTRSSRSSEESGNKTTRLIASRGSEIFTVVGNTLRWANLTQVRDEWEGSNNHSKVQNPAMETKKTTYKILKTTVYDKFTDLIISPSGHFLAICTKHAIHVAILPDSSRLLEHDKPDLKLKTYQLGPTTHVQPESPLRSVLWHPLANATPSSDCLVTVTEQAAVRVWEFDRANHWSFERPALAIDLRKLADGTSCDQDFEPLGFGKKHGFSADTFDMEVSASSFGGCGSEYEDPWASMTLWTTMVNGDIYALCPLIPSKWKPTATTIPALTTSTVSEQIGMQDAGLDADEQRAINQRLRWVQEIDDEDFEEDLVRLRPDEPSAIPRLQGPFEFPVAVSENDIEVSDIAVLPVSLDEDELFSGEDDYEIVEGGKTLPFTIICLATDTGEVHILLEVNGVSGQWLPKRGRNTFSMPTASDGELLLVETISLGEEGDVSTQPPCFSKDPTNAYRLFITSGDRVWSISLEDWALKLSFEASGSSTVDKGLHTRLAVACQGPICSLQELLATKSNKSAQDDTLTAVAMVEGFNIGPMLLTSAGGEALAVQFDTVSTNSQTNPSSDKDLTQSSPFRLSTSAKQALENTVSDDIDPVPTRAPYAPDPIFYANQCLPYEDLKSRIPAHRRPLLNEKPIRLSAACLEIMTAAHRTFSQQTADIESAAAELFRRCERLREELGEQIQQMARMANTLQELQSRDSGERDSAKSKQPFTVDQRIANAQIKNKDLVTRYEALRRKAGRLGNAKRELSTQEIGWVNEVDTLSKHVGISDQSQDTTTTPSTNSLEERYLIAKELSQDLTEQVKPIISDKSSSQEGTDSPTPTNETTTTKKLQRSGFNLSSRIQRERISEAMAMVERESAIIDAVMSRLERLKTDGNSLAG